MNKRQVIQYAKGYMDMLSRGIDPISRGEVGADSVLAEPRLQRCFSFVSEVLEELLANGGLVVLPGDADDAPRYELVRRKAAFHLSPEQRQGVFIAKGPVTPNVFVNSVNRVIDSASMEKLSVKRINAWLVKNEYVAEGKQPAVIQRTVMKPMERAAEIGIEAVEVTDPKTGEIKPRIVLTPQAQQFLLDHLDRILEEG